LPTARATGHIIVAGTLSAAAIAASTPLTSWTVQSDQKSASGDEMIPWAAPVAAVEAIPVFARYTTAADGSKRGDGFQRFTLTMSMWTFGMVYYVDTLLFAGGTLESADVSVRVYDRHGNPVFLNCIAERPDVTRAQPILGGYQDIPWEFHTGSTAASGGGALVASITLGAITTTAAGTVDVIGSGSMTLGAITTTGEGTVV
jgi:hypothetical protein